MVTTPSRFMASERISLWYGIGECDYRKSNGSLFRAPGSSAGQLSTSCCSFISARIGAR